MNSVGDFFAFVLIWFWFGSWFWFCLLFILFCLSFGQNSKSFVLNFQSRFHLGFLPFVIVNLHCPLPWMERLTGKWLTHTSGHWLNPKGLGLINGIIQRWRNSVGWGRCNCARWILAGGGGSLGLISWDCILPFSLFSAPGCHEQTPLSATHAHHFDISLAWNYIGHLTQTKTICHSFSGMQNLSV